MIDQRMKDVLSALQGRQAVSYVLANVLRRRAEYKGIKSHQVLHTLKRLEKEGLVRRVTDPRINPYAKMIMWEEA